MAENLNRVSMITLPSIPINVSVMSVEQESRRKAKIIWLMRIPDNHYDRIEYILEARAHIGHPCTLVSSLLTFRCRMTSTII